MENVLVFTVVKRRKLYIWTSLNILTEEIFAKKYLDTFF